MKNSEIGVVAVGLTVALLSLVPRIGWASVVQKGGELCFPWRRKKKIRVYMDGCFDLMHYGHANALRQAKALGDELVVGLVSDEEIEQNKGPPVMKMDERLAMVEAVKWVDEVIPGTPYEVGGAFMQKLFEEHRIDYIIHGDDPCLLPDGTDAYAGARRAGRFKQIKRTEGVSSTDIVGRMLLCVGSSLQPVGPPSAHPLHRQFSNSGREEAVDTRISHFLPTSRRIVQFSNGKGPPPQAKIVYIDGAFDLFHAGHVEILRLAKAQGDFLLVGIHTDQAVRSNRGLHHPIMNLHERSLSVLACRYVDEVIIGAPAEITKDLVRTFNISLVAHGTVAEENPFQEPSRDPYAVPKEMGIHVELASPRRITTSNIIARIFANRESYLARNSKKNKTEEQYYADKEYVAD